MKSMSSKELSKEQDRKMGATLAFIRKRDCNQSQADFAKRFGIGRSLLAAIESGQIPLRSDVGWKICSELDLNPSWLCGAGNSNFDNIFPLTDGDQIQKVQKMITASSRVPFRDFWPAIGGALLGDVRENNLTEKETFGNVGGVKRTWENLLAELRRATEPSGKVSDLAKFLSEKTGRKVPLASVSRWLADTREPGARITMLMLQWVERERVK